MFAPEALAHIITPGGIFWGVLVLFVWGVLVWGAEGCQDGRRRGVHRDGWGKEASPVAGTERAQLTETRAVRAARACLARFCELCSVSVPFSEY